MQHKPVSFKLTRGEGPSAECRKPQTVTTWEDTDKILKHWARNAPDDGCYDKCDFTVTYDDGETYTGRYDLKRHDKVFSGLLARHMRGLCMYYAGRAKPDHVKTEELYQSYIKDQKEEYVKFLKNYQIS